MRACVQEGRVMFGNTCLDEDLITPISDNEYVLKGSEIIPFVFDYPLKSYAEKSSCLIKDEVINKDKNAKELASSTTPSSFSSSYSLSPPQQTRLANDTTKRNSSASSNMFRNLITCGVVNTNDAVVVMLNPANKTYSCKSNSSQAMIMADHRISKGDHKLAGRSAGVSGTCQNPQQLPQQPHTASSSDGEKDATKQQKEREFSGQKAASAAYRTIGRPHCSQCRKLFKPEKLHSHMKSCRGMKAETKIPEMGSRNPQTPRNPLQVSGPDELNMPSND
ncbi:protein SOSEKI 1-like [Malus sylvestris]|uniref:protein SOSEKI 1-like n=1 Tax=Malus sylvestris TaxID=3752 RepID=UPI0021ACEE9E|nr:protein SOSEKI 1-like [Malus sylvestris]